MNEACRAVVERLALQPHAEGGWFRRTYTCAAPSAQPELACGSAIYYLLESGDFSAFHELVSDEVLHHYAGAPVTVFILSEQGCRTEVLGDDVAAGQSPQLTMRAGTMFALAAGVGEPYALMGCTVFPEFAYGGWRMPGAAQLNARFPGQEEIIGKYTRTTAQEGL